MFPQTARALLISACNKSKLRRSETPTRADAQKAKRTIANRLPKHPSAWHFALWPLL